MSHDRDPDDSRDFRGTWDGILTDLDAVSGRDASPITLQGVPGARWHAWHDGRSLLRAEAVDASGAVVARYRSLPPINPSEAIDEAAEYIVNPNAWNYEPIGNGWHRQTPIYRQQGPLYDAGAVDREKVLESVGMADKRALEAEKARLRADLMGALGLIIDTEANP